MDANFNIEDLKIYFTNDRFKSSNQDRNIWVKEVSHGNNKYFIRDFYSNAYTRGTGCSYGLKPSIVLSCNGEVDFSRTN